MSANSSSFTSVFYKAASQANPGAERKWAKPSLCLSRHVFQKLSNTSEHTNYYFCMCVI